MTRCRHQSMITPPYNETYSPNTLTPIFRHPIIRKIPGRQNRRSAGNTIPQLEGGRCPRMRTPSERRLLEG